MPTILFLFGLRFFFYSDEHLPMHVHVKNGDGKAKINIETAEVVENSGIKPAAEESRVCSQAVQG